MSMSDKVLLARRPFVAGLMGALALAVVAAWEAPKVFPKLFARRYPPSPFDDLLALLPDRENAVRLAAALDGGRRKIDARSTAAKLRRTVGGHSLAAVIADDLAENRLVEAQGWLIPESLAELCALAAMVEPLS
jgi:hypothetical protein